MCDESSCPSHLGILCMPPAPSLHKRKHKIPAQVPCTIKRDNDNVLFHAAQRQHIKELIYEGDIGPAGARAAHDAYSPDSLALLELILTPSDLEGTGVPNLDQVRFNGCSYRSSEQS